MTQLIPDRLRRLLLRCWGGPAAALTDDATLGDLGMDAMDVQDFVRHAIQCEFGVDLGDIRPGTTLGDLAAAIAAARQAPAAAWLGAPEGARIACPGHRHVVIAHPPLLPTPTMLLGTGPLGQIHDAVAVTARRCGTGWAVPDGITAEGYRRMLTVALAGLTADDTAHDVRAPFPPVLTGHAPATPIMVAGTGVAPSLPGGRDD